VDDSSPLADSQPKSVGLFEGWHSLSPSNELHEISPFCLSMTTALQTLSLILIIMIIIIILLLLLPLLTVQPYVFRPTVPLTFYHWGKWKCQIAQNTLEFNNLSVINKDKWTQSTLTEITWLLDCSIVSSCSILICHCNSTWSQWRYQSFVWSSQLTPGRTVVKVE